MNEQRLLMIEPIAAQPPAKRDHQRADDRAAGAAMSEAHSANPDQPERNGQDDEDVAGFLIARGVEVDFVPRVEGDVDAQRSKPGRRARVPRGKSVCNWRAKQHLLLGSM